jgi:hypothetical protein
MGYNRPDGRSEAAPAGEAGRRACRQSSVGGRPAADGCGALSKPKKSSRRDLMARQLPASLLHNLICPICPKACGFVRSCLSHGLFRSRVAEAPGAAVRRLKLLRFR